jgi:signal peptidase I
MTEENIVQEETVVKKTKKERTKLNKTVRFFVSVILILLVGYGVLNYVPFIAKYDSYVIATGSMAPVINVRDIAVIDSSVTVDELEVGEIIAFNIDINDDGIDDVVVHYLYSIEEVDGELVLRTKPEISDQVDGWVLTVDDYLGRHVLTIRKIGGLLLFASSTIGKVVLLLDVFAIYLIIEFLADPKKEKKDQKEIHDDIKESEKN